MPLVVSGRLGSYRERRVDVDWMVIGKGMRTRHDVWIKIRIVLHSTERCPSENLLNFVGS